MAQATQPRISPRVVRIIERRRLLAQLEAATARTILLTAPAGYGKTTLIRQWLATRAGGVATVGLAGNDVAVLARSLGTALAPVLPDVPRFVEEAIKAAPAPEQQ